MAIRTPDDHVKAESNFGSVLSLPGGRRAAEEKGDVRRSSSHLRPGRLSGEGGRPEHPCPGALRALLRHRSHRWQAAPVRCGGTEHSDGRMYRQRARSLAGLLARGGRAARH